MSCGVGHRPSSDLALLWLRCKPAATAPIRCLAWELLYAVGTAIKRQERERERERKRRKEERKKEGKKERKKEKIGSL